MRPIIFLISLLFVSSHSWGQGRRDIDRPDRDQSSRNSWTAPTINANQISNINFDATTADFSAIEQSIQQKIRFSPPIEVNSNLGNLLTYVEIPLPENFSGMKGLRLNYNSANPFDNGLGIGWEWALPFIDINPSSKELAPFRVRGTWNTSLVSTNEDLTWIKDNILTLTEISDEYVSLHSYRMSVDESFCLFVQVKQAGRSLAWIVFTLEGSQWVFSAEGLPIALFNSFSTPLRFTWKSGVLEKVIGEKEGFSLAINYKNANRWTTISGKHTYAPGLIDTAILAYAKTTRQFDFNYQNNYLIKVKEPKNPMALFQADYQNFARKEISPIPNSLEAFDKRKAYFLNDLAEAELGPKAENNNYIEYFVDLNSDGREDKIVIDLREYKQRIRYYLDMVEFELKSGNSPASCVMRAKRSHVGGVNVRGMDLAQLIQEETPIKIFMNVWNGNHAEFKEDSSLSLKGKDFPIFNVDVSENPVIRDNCHNFYDLTVEFNQRTLYFEDLNHDGRKDIISCQSDKQLDKERIKHTQGGSYYSNLTLSLLEQMNKLEFKGKNFTRVLNAEGHEPLVLLNQADEKKMASFWEQVKETNDGSIQENFIRDVSKWAPTKVNFRCNQYSVFIDHNRDGFADVITGNKIYYLDENINARSVEYKLEDILDTRTDVPDLASPNLIFFDSENNGKLRLHDVKSIKFNPLKGFMELWNTGETKRFIPASSHKMIRHFYSPFEGFVRIKYKFQAGRYVVETLIHDPQSDSARPWQQTFAYDTVMKDPYTGLFLGFYKTTELMNYNDPHHDDFKIERFFRKDTHPSATLFQERGRLNGELILEKKSDLEKENHQTKISKREIVNLGANRIWSRPIKEITISENGGRSSQTVKNIYVTLDKTNDQFFIKHKKTIYSKENNISPELSVTDPTLPQDVFVVEADYQFLSNLFQLPQTKEMRKRGKGETHVATSTINPTTGLLDQFSVSGRTISLKYDWLRRLTQEIHPNNKIIEATYQDNTPKVKTYTGQKGRQLYAWNYLDDKLEGHTWRGLSFRFSYQGEMLSKIEKSIENTYQTLFEASVEPKARCEKLPEIYSCLAPVIQLKELDVEKKLFVDGMGRVIESFTDSKDGQISLGPKFLVGPNSAPIAMIPRKLDGIEAIDHESFYDYLGREKFTHFPTGVEKSIRHEYVGNCEEIYEKNILKSRQCYDFLGDIAHTWIGNEVVNFERGTSGEILAVNDLALTYLYNQYGELKEAQGEMRGSDINSFKRTFDHTEDGSQKISNFGFVWTLDGWGNVLEAKTNKNNPYTLAIEAQYEHGQLINEKIFGLSLKKGEQPSLIAEKNIKYDQEGRVRDSSILGLNQHQDYDHFGRLKTQSLSYNNSKVFQVDYRYLSGQVSEIRPFFSNLHYAADLSLSALISDSGLRKDVEKDESLKLTKNIQYEYRGKLLWREDLTYTSEHKFRSKNNINLLSEAENTSFTYNEQGELNLRAPNKSLIKNFKLGLKDEQIVDITNAQEQRISNFYSVDGDFIGSCPYAKNLVDGLASTGDECFIMLSPTEASIEGNYLRLHQYMGQSIALQINDEFFYIVEDVQGSIRGLISQEGELLWERNFSPWGEKKVNFLGKNLEREKELERLTIWSFAKLIHNPLLEKNHQSNEPFLYWSTTRIYNSDSGLWLTYDSTLATDPKKLADQPGNWHNLRYANNDPVNYIDPSGRYLMKVIFAFGAMAKFGIDYTLVPAACSGIIGGVTENWGHWSSKGATIGFLHGLVFAGFGVGATRLVVNAGYSKAQGFLTASVLSSVYSSLSSIGLDAASNKKTNGNELLFSNFLNLTSGYSKFLLTKKLKQAPEALIDLSVSSMTTPIEIIYRGTQRENEDDTGRK